MHQLNGLLYKACKDYRHNFIDIGAVLKRDLWTYGIHLLKSGKAVLIIFLNSNAKLQESLGKEKDCACCENNYNKEIRG